MQRSTMSSVDTKTLLIAAEYEGGVRCKGSPLKATFTPGEGGAIGDPPLLSACC